MKIASANLQMASTHVSQSTYESSESLKAWVGPQRPDFSGDSGRQGRPMTDVVSLSPAAQAPQPSSAATATDRQDSAIDSDPKLGLIRYMLEYLTGRRIDVFDAHDLQGGGRSTPMPPTAAGTPATPAQGNPPPAGFGIEYDRHESYSEFEQTDFAASGSVTTADGRTIEFSLQLSMQRSFHQESDVSLRLGDAARKTDPLVLNFAGTAAQLTDQRFAFDLNNDGSKEQINFVAPGSGFLVFDRNRDGVVNNGSELFGPTTNDGFGELAALDQDQNGWIDENDAAFNQLQIWSRNAAGEDQLQSLSTAGVGAISLSNVATPFEVKNYANQLLGEIRNSGIFLQENGRTGTIQQIDLTA